VEFRGVSASYWILPPPLFSFIIIFCFLLFVVWSASPLFICFMIRRGLLFHYDTLVLLEGGLDLYTKYVERERERDGAERENGHANWQGPAWVTVKGGKPGVLS
jgi:hypothetical protein